MANRTNNQDETVNKKTDETDTDFTNQGIKGGSDSSENMDDSNLDQ